MNYWNPDLPIIKLPENIKDIFSEEAGYLHTELKNSPIKKRKGKYFTENPKWYSELYKIHKNFRKDRSLKAIKRITKLQDRQYRNGKFGFLKSIYKYDKIYREFLFKILTQGYIHDGYRQEPNQETVRYFGVRKDKQKIDYEFPNETMTA